MTKRARAEFNRRIMDAYESRSHDYDEVAAALERAWAEAYVIAEWCGSCGGKYDPGTIGFQLRVDRVINEAHSDAEAVKR